MAKTGGWFTVMGIVFIILGILAIVEPAVAGLAVTVLVGWLLIAGGLAHLVQAFGAGGIGRALWQVALGALYALGGFYFLTHPLLALGTLTLMLAGILFAEAVLWLVAYFQVRRAGGFAWLLLNAIVTLLLAGMIWRQWPSSSVWAIGTLVGVNLLMAGFSRLMLGSALRGLETAVRA
jgi:uncharacterized membrane protein HdeD (DUF308 family)